ncbi:hypothetical protein HHI36_012250 [Cryptolaemus montrouzieri]|uniref:Uncharacterized protein n=1 Tax=Cryptolaemus montrouzieri TaxID=559131 RepID=A0ABD2NEA6_9CUCU
MKKLILILVLTVVICNVLAEEDDPPYLPKVPLFPARDDPKPVTDAAVMTTRTSISGAIISGILVITSNLF